MTDYSLSLGDVTAHRPLDLSPTSRQSLRIAVISSGGQNIKGKKGSEPNAVTLLTITLQCEMYIYNSIDTIL